MRVGLGHRDFSQWAAMKMSLGGAAIGYLGPVISSAGSFVYNGNKTNDIILLMIFNCCDNRATYSQNYIVVTFKYKYKRLMTRVEDIINIIIDRNMIKY